MGTEKAGTPGGLFSVCETSSGVFVAFGVVDVGVLGSLSREGVKGPGACSFRELNISMRRVLDWRKSREVVEVQGRVAARHSRPASDAGVYKHVDL